MPQRRGFLAPQNTFLDTIATRFDGTHSNFVLGNAQTRERPIVYCSDGFCELTGFARAQVMSRGCACRFLWGERTAEDEKTKIEDSLEQQKELKTEVIFYTKTRNAFLCLLDIVPIKNEKGEVVLFLASHKDITKEKGAGCGLLSPSGDAANNQSDQSGQCNNVSPSNRPRSRLSDISGPADAADNESSSSASVGAGSNPDEEDNNDEEEERSTAYKYERRRSRAVLYHLSGQFDSKSKNKTFSQLNKIQSLSGKNALPEYKVQEIKRSRCILLHYGLLKITWDWLILLCTFYIAIMVPYNAASSSGKLKKASGADDAGIAVDLLVEVVFIADICINFRTTFVSKSGQVVYCQRMIAINYLKTWFFLDMLAAVPFDIIILISNAVSSDLASKMFCQDAQTAQRQGLGSWPACFISQLESRGAFSETFNLMKLARMLRLLKLYQKIDRYAQYSSLVLLLLISMFALSAHWFACIWLVIGRKQLEVNQTREISWINKLSTDINAPFNFSCAIGGSWAGSGSTAAFSFDDEPPGGNESCSIGGPAKASRYITALYYTCSSLTSIGFGNVSANTDHEKIFSICVMLIGALMHAAVFGNVTALIQKMYAKRAAYTAKTQELKDFTRTHHIPKHLKRRMQEFFQAMWSINRGINPSEIMKDFPEELRGDIALHLNREILSLPIFETASQGCLKAIAQQIQTVFCRPEEYLVHSGDVLKYIYFVVNGSMEILKENMVVAILGKGDLFGTDIKNPEGLMRSMCDVRSLTYCDVQCIELKGLIQLLLQYPEYHEKFKEDLLHDLTYNMREGSDLEEEEYLNEHSTIMPAITLPSIGEEKEGDIDEDNEDEEDNSDEDGDEDSGSNSGRRKGATGGFRDKAVAAIKRSSPPPPSQQQQQQQQQQQILLQTATDATGTPSSGVSAVEAPAPSSWSQSVLVTLSRYFPPHEATSSAPLPSAPSATELVNLRRQRIAAAAATASANSTVAAAAETTAGPAPAAATSSTPSVSSTSDFEEPGVALQQHHLQPQQHHPRFVRQQPRSSSMRVRLQPTGSGGSQPTPAAAFPLASILKKPGGSASDLSQLSAVNQPLHQLLPPRRVSLTTDDPTLGGRAEEIRHLRCEVSELKDSLSKLHDRLDLLTGLFRDRLPPQTTAVRSFGGSRRSPPPFQSPSLGRVSITEMQPHDSSILHHDSDEEVVDHAMQPLLSPRN